MSKDSFVHHLHGSVHVIELSLPQSLDSAEFDSLNDSLGRLFAQDASGHWVIDLSGLSYMGSSALGLMVNIRQQIKSGGGRLILCGLSPRLLQIFHTCCMERLFQIVKTRDEAIKKA